MTEEEGTVSGDLDITVDETGKGLVRYRGTDSWYTIGNLEAEPPRTWTRVADLAAAIESGIGKRDAAGNTAPFEATPAGSEGDQPTDSPSDQPTDSPGRQADPGQGGRSAADSTGRKDSTTADLDDRP
ncbi:hypothetical protein ACLMAJ_35015 [Nocardia sp. KC 131]|uniref:hypothetical protein n=1 Tax=Nocardia arseniciresistens TaxID=3392119 RepID=UPI00398F26F4